MGAVEALFEARKHELANIMSHLMRYEVWRIGPVEITSTVRNTWIIMIVLFVAVYFTTRRFSQQPKGVQTVLELILSFYLSLIDTGMGRMGRRFLPIVGTVFTFVFVLNVSWFIPGMLPPTTDLSTTAALAVTTILMVQVAGIMQNGWRGYLRNFAQPSPVLLPMNIIEELVKPISLAVRLFCNMLGEKMAVTILFILVPLLVPVPIMFLGLLMGAIQAYIFCMLSVSYLASTTKGH